MAAKTRMKDIAERLGVSAATVSRALNDKPGVADGMRQRVLEVATELDFRPNIAARSLSLSSTQSCAVAFVVHQQAFPVASDPFYFVIMRGVERILARDGYHAVLVTVGDDQKEAASGLRAVSEGRVDGLILSGPDIDAGLVLSLARRGLPLVLVDNALERTALDCVLCDNKEGARSVVEHLLWHGHERVAFAGGPLSWLSTRERQAGYERAMREVGLETHAVHEEATTTPTGVNAGRKLLASDPRPSAIFAVNDAMALGVIRAAREAGLRVPEDLAVVGFDDISMSESAHPPLTTVRVAKEVMGEIAARCLLESIRGERRTPVKSLVGTTLVVRASCGCAAD